MRTPERNCETCKHRYQSNRFQPCFDCIASDADFDRWEPITPAAAEAGAAGALPLRRLASGAGLRMILHTPDEARALVRAHIDALGLTCEAYAMRCGAHSSTISEWLLNRRDRRMPSAVQRDLGLRMVVCYEADVPPPLPAVQPAQARTGYDLVAMAGPRTQPHDPQTP